MSIQCLNATCENNNVNGGGGGEDSDAQEQSLYVIETKLVSIQIVINLEC